MIAKPKNPKLATAFAFTSLILPISGVHKFYLGQPRWGIVYLLLSWTPIPKVASVIEGIWYLLQSQDEFNRNFNATQSVAMESHLTTSDQVEAIATALRQLDQLRQDGLLSEYEFEQKRRQLLDRIS